MKEIIAAFFGFGSFTPFVKLSGWFGNYLEWPKVCFVKEHVVK